MSVDLANLPPDVKAAIDAYIQQALAAQQPAPPPELTPEEKLQEALDAVARELVAEKRIPSGSDALHLRIYDVLNQLADHVKNHVEQQSASADNAGANTENQG